MYDTYVKSGSARKVRRRFRHKFQNVTVPQRETVHRLVNKVRWTGSVLDRKAESKRRVLTEEKLDEIGAQLEHTPRKSLRRLAQETGISISSARTAIRLLKHVTFKTVVIFVGRAGRDS
jgi:transposase